MKGCFFVGFWTDQVNILVGRAKVWKSYLKSTLTSLERDWVPVLCRDIFR